MKLNLSGGDGTAVPAQMNPGLEAADILSTPSPTDPPVAHPAPLTDGHGFLLGTVAEAGALAASEAGRAEAIKEVGELRAAETPAACQTAIASHHEHEQAQQAEARFAETIRTRFGTRLDRTRGVVKKVIFIYMLLALGEVALNTSAGVAQGEVLWLAALGFIAVSAGAVAVGWAVGSGLRDATDRVQAGAPPQDAAELGITALYLPAGKGRWATFDPSLWIWTVALLGLAVFNALLIAEMRQEAGMSGAWGPVAGFLVVIAAAPPFLLRNKASDLLDEATRRQASERKLAAEDARVIDSHTAAQARTWASQLRVDPIANAQYATALAGAWGQIVTKNAHIVGHTMATGQLPVVADQLKGSPAITSGRATPEEPFISDFARAMAAREPEVTSAGHVSNSPMTEMPLPEEHPQVDLDPTELAEFAPLDTVITSNGHGSAQ